MKCLRVSIATVLMAAIPELACSSAKPPAPKVPAQQESEPVAPGQPSLQALAPDEPASALPIEADDARIGSPTPKVTVVGFLDFQCPYCAEGFRTLVLLSQKYQQKDVRFVFKHLPLESHQLALPAAIAGQAVMQLAGSEAFFDFATLAFDGQSTMDFTKLAAWAEQVGVTRSTYNEAVENESLIRRVARDAILAQSLGVSSTPSFFVNGRLISGAQPPSTFTSEIEAELEAMADVPPNERAQRYAARVDRNTKRSLAQALLEDDPSDYRVPVDGSATLGPEDALVTVVSFSDYECPYCKRAEETLAELRQNYGKQVRFVFKHHPLPFHKSALPSARLAEAVRAKSGDAAFFDVSAELFAEEGAFSTPGLRALGKKYGLSAEDLRALAGEDSAIETRIERDGFLSDDVLASGTPHFFINGKRLAGARPLPHFEALIDSELERARNRVQQGTPPEKVYETLQRDAIAPGAPKRLSLPSIKAGPTRGSKEPTVTVHIFSDFQCPYCKQAEETLTRLQESFGGQLSFVWHNLPLDFHDRARPAARAAVEAYRQKGEAGFWKMHDALFGPPGEPAALSHEDLLAYGKALGLEPTSFSKALSEDPRGGSIEADEKLAEQLGIRGTPAFVVGNYLITGARQLPHFERVVKMAIEERQGEERQGEGGAVKD